MIDIPLIFVILIEVVVRKNVFVTEVYYVSVNIGKVIVFILMMIFINVSVIIFRGFVLFVFVGRARFGVILLLCLFFRWWWLLVRAILRVFGLFFIFISLILRVFGYSHLSILLLFQEY